MADKARVWTDKELAEIEKRIEKIYKTAQKEITVSWNEYMKKVSKKLQKLQDDYDKAKQSGDKDLIKKTGEKLGKAKASETYQNQRYKAMLDDVTDKLANVNQTAISYINGELPSIYAVNYNGIAPQADKVGLDFSLVDDYTVRRLALDGDIKLPYKDLNKIKDKLWNTRQLNSSVLQGILQGEPINKIADRIYPIVNNNKVAAIRNARTMVTGAENRGRYDSAVELEELGAVIEKKWIATHDSRTRESHIEIDGQTVELHKPFGNGLMYPGDPNGAPEEVYNCRCSMSRRIIAVKT